MILNRFEDFILESYIMKLNESVIEFSDEFQEVLSMIDSPIAKELIKAHKKDVEVKANWFDIGKDQDHLTFLIDAKAQKLENPYVRITINAPVVGYHWRNLFKEIDFDPNKQYIPAINDIGKIIGSKTYRSSLFYLLSFNDDDSKQCVIRSEYVEPDDTIYWRKNRQEIRVGRGIRALLQSLKLNFTDAQIEDFVNRYKAAFDITKDAFRNFELVKGNKIAELYHQDNYLLPSVGELGNSCMKAKPSWYFGIYTLNSAVCSLLVLKSVADKSKIVGRAIVWNLRKPDITLMDRVYANTPAQVELFRRYAQSKGWHYKKYNDNSTRTETIAPDGSTENFEEFAVRIKRMDYTGFPYVDTLKYFDDSSDYYYLTTSQKQKRLEDTDGNWIDDDACECCGGRGREGCAYCDATGTVECGECTDGKTNCIGCKGKGKIKCSNCRKGCDECESGLIDCPDCNGDGKVTCLDCEGDGTYECTACEGDGQVDCTCCS